MQDEQINKELQNLINNETISPTDTSPAGLINLPNERQNNQLEERTPELVPSFDTSKLERRGRHKKDCTCDKCQAKKGEASGENILSSGEALPTSSTIQAGTSNSKISNTNPLDLSEFKKTELNANSPNETEVNAVKYITGSLMLMLIDAVAPSLLIKVLGMTNPKFKNISSKKVRLSKDQKEDLEPLANEAVKQMTINMNPMTAFFLCTSLIYATNIMTAVED
jgi:hypothetical protein